MGFDNNANPLKTDNSTASVDGVSFDDFGGFNDDVELHNISESVDDSVSKTDVFADTLLNEQVDSFQETLNNLPSNTYHTVLNSRGREIVLYPLNHQKFSLVLYQIITCLTLFTILGLNDQSTGSLIPILTEKYNVSHVQVSNIFLIQTFGYTFSAFINDKLHRIMGTRGVMVSASITLSVFLFLLALKPRWFPLYVLYYFPVGVSIGLIDSVVNVLFGSLVVHKNEFLGIVHAIYGCFSFITPIVINRFGHLHWNRFFYIPCFLSLAGGLMSLYTFRFETHDKYIYLCDEKDQAWTDPEQDEDEDATQASINDDGKLSVFQLLSQQPLCLLYALYLFFYLGTEVGTGSWIFTYLLDVKKGEPRGMSYITSSYWAGLTLGRLYFGFMTKKWFINEYLASKFYGNVTFLFYLVILLLGLLPSNSTFYFVVLSFVVFMAGMWIGPLFPLASVVALDVLPQRLHITGLSTAISLGCTGAAVLPWIYGVIMQVTSIAIFPLLVVMSCGTFQLVWLLYPKVIKNKQKVFFNQSL